MNTQTYYRCGNCENIAAKDAGDRHNMCADCGSVDLKVLVSVDEDSKGDPLSDLKKKALATLVGLVVVAVVSVFLIFGRLLQGYIEYDTNHEVAEKANGRLVKEIQGKEATLELLAKKAIEEKAQIVENARQTESAASSAKAILAETEDALQRTRVALTNSSAKAVGIRAELGNLEDESGRLRKRVDALGAEEAHFLVTLRAAATRTNRLAAEVATAEKAQVVANGELARAIGAVEVANTAREKAKEELGSILNRVTSLTVRREALEEEFRDKQKTQATLDASIAELKKQHSALLGETTKARAVLDSLLAERDKAHEEADVQSARAATLKAEVAGLERIKANAEKTKGEIGK